MHIEILARMASLRRIKFRSPDLDEYVDFLLQKYLKMYQLLTSKEKRMAECEDDNDNKTTESHRN